VRPAALLGQPDNPCEPMVKRIEVFRVVRTSEFGLTLIEESLWARLEISQSTIKPSRYRARLYRQELFRIQSTFPQRDGEPADEPSDESIWVDWSEILRTFTSPFTSRSAMTAERAVLAEVRQWLSHSLGTCSKANHTWGDCSDEAAAGTAKRAHH
jgi:hypothetical protein